MYRLGTRERKRKRRLVWLAAGLGGVLIIAVGLLIIHLLRPTTTIKQAAAVTTKVAATSQPTKVFNEGIFSISVPSDWRLASHEQQPYNIYTWESDPKKSTSQQLQIYVDSTPANFAVNRALAIEASGSQLSVLGEASDNCSEFTKGSATTVGTRAKWQGIDFLCDLANYERDVIGTVSGDGINTVVLKAPNGATHQLFFTFTERGVNGNYAPFYNALDSFKLQ